MNVCVSLCEFLCVGACVCQGRGPQTLLLTEINQILKLSLANPLEGWIHTS